MTEDELIRQLLYQYEYTGLVEKNLDRFLECLSEQILGIGLGEQGFVTSVQDIRDVYESGLKTDDTAEHTLELGRVEILKPVEGFAIVCAQVTVHSHPRDGIGKNTKSQFQQTLVMTRQGEGWRVCGLHASTPTITEEDLEAFPLRFAEKTLRSMKEKIGEEAYLAEEQYRKAVLADTVAFYIINFTQNRFEKCQLQDDLCAYVEAGTPYEEFVTEKTADYVVEEDRERFIYSLSLRRIEETYQSHGSEVSCDYRLRRPDGTAIWARTIIRLIRDVVTGDKKGIMYVKDIDKETREAQDIRKKADFDGMTHLLNRDVFIRNVNFWLQEGRKPEGGLFLMVDVDNFKEVNDTFGHPAGDQVLIAVANMLREIFGAAVPIGRLGGDEFGVFLPGARWDAAVQARVEQLLDAARRFRFAGEAAPGVTVSIGCAGLRTGRFDELYHAADRALYRAKKAGRDTAAIAEDIE